YKKML
ncbi:unnamed protein product, partial [Callosobruchus maculatus]